MILTTSPLRILRALCFRLRAQQPYDIVPTIIEHQCDREAREINACSAENATVERGLSIVSARLHAALTDSETPGMVTPAEARGIARVLVTTKGRSSTLTQHLNRLAR